MSAHDFEALNINTNNSRNLNLLVRLKNMFIFI